MESRADTFGAFDFSTVLCSLSRNRYPRIVMENRKESDTSDWRGEK